MRLVTKLIFVLGVLPGSLWPQTSQSQADDLVTRSKQAYMQEGPKAALPGFEEALRIYRNNRDRRGEAITLGYISNCYRKLEDLDKALQFARQALEMKEQLGDQAEIGKTHNQLGLIYWERANYPEAIGNLRQAIEISSSVGDRELEGSALNNLGLVFDEQGEFHKSLEQYQRALDLHRATHFERGEGDTLGNIGGVYLLLGEFRKALTYYQQGLEISQRLGLKPASSDDLGNIALCLAGLGDVDGALKNFDQALRVAHEAGLAKEEADWRKGKGSTLVGLGRYDAALAEYSAAEQVYEHAGLKRELIEALEDTGHVYELVGDAQSAGQRFERALRLAGAIGNVSGESATLLSLGDLARREKNYELADSHFKASLQKARTAGEEKFIISVLLQRALNEIDRKRYESALQSASEAQQRAEKSENMPAVALSHYVVGEVRRSQAQPLLSLEEYSAAQTLNAQLRDPELGWRIQYGRGQALIAEKKTDEAVDAYKAAVDIIETTRSAIAEEQYQAGYIEDRYQVYVALVELLLKLHRPEDAFLYSEKLRSRSYQDSLGGPAPSEEPAGEGRKRELEERIRKLRLSLEKEYAIRRNERRANAVELFSEELAKAEREYEALLNGSEARTRIGRSAHVVSVADVQQLLSQNTALIEYVVGRDMLSILLVTPTSVFGTPVQITSASLSSRTELLRALIVEHRSEWITPARGLRKALVDPIEGTGNLNSIQKLLIVPDGVLNYLPFATLPSDSRRLLGQQFLITYLPAAATLSQHAETFGGRSLLAMAPSHTQLPNAPLEVRDIGRIFGSRSRVVVGKAATKTLFKQVASDYDYLHLATHSSLNRNAPSLSAIELEPDEKNDGRLELYEIASMKLHARLVTLSACETALGKGYFSEIPAGDDFVGLTRAFLGAGGQNVLASLWAVNDESTRVLMRSFYRHLQVSNAAEALAQAQQEVRADARFRHPYYWAPFVVVGAEN